MLLFTLHNNQYKHENDKFLVKGIDPDRSYSIGSWFNCTPEQVERIREGLLQNKYTDMEFIPSNADEAKDWNEFG